MAKTKLDKEMRPVVKLNTPAHCKLPVVVLKSNLPPKDHLREYLRRFGKPA